MQIIFNLRLFETPRTGTRLYHTLSESISDTPWARGVVPHSGAGLLVVVVVVVVVVIVIVIGIGIGIGIELATC